MRTRNRIVLACLLCCCQRYPKSPATSLLASGHHIPVPAAPVQTVSPISEEEARSGIVDALLAKADSEGPPMAREPFTASPELKGLVDVVALLMEGSSVALHRQPAPGSEIIANLNIDGFRDTPSGTLCPWHFDFYPSSTSRDPKNAKHDLRVRCGDIAQYGEREEMGLPVFEESRQGDHSWLLVVINDKGEGGWLRTRAAFFSMTKLWKEKHGAHMTMRWDGRVFDRPGGSFKVRNIDTFFDQPFKFLASQRYDGRLWIKAHLVDGVATRDKPIPDETGWVLPFSDQGTVFAWFYALD